ncbi:MAG: hypothetical protein IJT41_05450 [Clostridia bacterium]|nr:hypothetical protein [Clostridia bacterium]
MKDAILKDFENWNSGFGAWSAWADQFYTEDVQYDYRGTQYDLGGLKDAMRPKLETSQRVRINNILISEDWAAIHFWSSVTNENGEKEAENHMQFLHFVKTDSGVKVDMCFAK